MDERTDAGGRAAAGPVLTALVGAVAGGLLAVFAAAALALVAGSLTPWVSVASIGIGLAGGTAAALSTRSRHLEDARRLSRLDVLAFAAFAAVSIRQFGWLVFERGGTLLTLLPYNLGDLPLHWTYVQFLAGGASFWPENPIATGERLRYPFGVDLLTAAFVQTGAGLTWLFPVLGLVGAVLVALALHRWGGALAVAGFVFSGGLPSLEALAAGRSAEVESALAWKNLFLALLVPQRGFLLALPAGLLLLWSFRRRLLRGETALPSWVEGLLWGTLPLVHLHTFALVSLVIAAWSLAGGGAGVRRAVPAFLWAVLPATWGVWQVSDGFGAASLVGWKPGWMIGAANPLAFFALNFGLFLPLSVAAAVVAVREGRREERLVLAPALLVFALLFLVRVAPWEWDNTKLLLWCYVMALPPIGTLVLDRAPRAWRAALLCGLLIPGAISALAGCFGGRTRLEIAWAGELESVCEALSRVPRSDRVATLPSFNHPVALCGHPLVMGYPGHLWSHGIDATRTERALASLMVGGTGWRDAARSLNARWIFWGPRERSTWPGSPRGWAEGGPVKAGEWGELYRLE